MILLIFLVAVGYHANQIKSMQQKIGIACIIQNNQVLIGKRTDNRKNWEFPGGKVEKNETVIEAIIREALEELQIHIKCNDVFHIENDGRRELHFAIAKIISGSPTPIVHSELKWIEPINLLSSMTFPKANIVATKKLSDLLKKL